MSRLSYLVNTWANWQVTACSWLMVVLGIAMTVVILMQVFCRFVIYIPVPWSEELARYLMVWTGMSGAVAALRKGRHIGVRVLVERLPGRTYDYVVPLVQLGLTAFLGVMVWQGIELSLMNSDQLSPAMEIPMLIPYSAVPVGCAMMAIGLIADFLQDLFPTPAGSDANLAASVLLGDSPADACKLEEK